ERIVHRRRSAGVKFGDEVMPFVRSEGGETQAGIHPLPVGVVEDTPGVGGIIGLPCEVVDVPTRFLLTLEFNCLRSVCRGTRDIEVKFVFQITDGSGWRSILRNVPIGVLVSI